MKQEDKELLIKDLCARLPYGIKCHIGDNKPYTLSSVSDDYDGTIVRFKEQKNGFNMEVYIQECKPYLFPMSSMTFEQECKYREVIESALNRYEVYDWLNKNHFDYRKLIKKSLALDATNLNIY